MLTCVYKDVCGRNNPRHYLGSKSLKESKCLSIEGMNIKHGYNVN